MSLDVERIVNEFKNYDLDPGKIKTEKIFGELLSLKQTLDLSTTAHTRTANAFLASLFQVIGYKAGIAHYWERVLEDALKAKKIEVKVRLRTEGKAFTKEELADAIDADLEVVKLAERLSVAAASRFFWDHVMEMLHEISKRVDSASMSLGVEAKLKGN